MPFRYQVSREGRFSSAHRLRDYQGPCEQLHGHNWRVRVTVGSDTLDQSGMVMDFRLLGKQLADVLRRFDHAYLNEVAPFDAQNPTSENIARYVFEVLNAQLAEGTRAVDRVEVWETEQSKAVVIRT
jgi:6-pyruvoyltetrahydropterin/6-carboxytetrahydropterin synthase